MQPADGALSAIETSGNHGVSVGIGVEYRLGTHLNADSTGFAPSPVDYDGVWPSLNFLFLFYFAHLFLFLAAFFFPFTLEDFPAFTTALFVFFVFLGLATLRVAFALSRP